MVLCGYQFSIFYFNARVGTYFKMYLKLFKSKIYAFYVFYYLLLILISNFQNFSTAITYVYNISESGKFI